MPCKRLLLCRIKNTLIRPDSFNGPFVRSLCLDLAELGVDACHPYPSLGIGCRTHRDLEKAGGEGEQSGFAYGRLQILSVSRARCDRVIIRGAACTDVIGALVSRATRKRRKKLGLRGELRRPSLRALSAGESG